MRLCTIMKQFGRAKEPGPPNLDSESPATEFLIPRCNGQKGSVRECGLVGCAFRHEDEVNAAVGLLRAFFGGSGPDACGDAGKIDLLLGEILLCAIGAGLGQFLGVGFLGIGVADDHQLGVGFALQAQGNVVANALASVVEAASTELGVTAVADLGSLRRRSRLLNVNRRGRTGTATAAVVGRACDRIISSRETRGIKLRGRAIPGNLAACGGVTVRQWIAVRTAGRRNKFYALAGDERGAFRRAGDDRGLIWPVGGR